MVKGERIVPKILTENKISSYLSLFFSSLDHLDVKILSHFKTK